MSNIPKLRFPEFKGKWEEKKLSDIASFSNIRNTCKKCDYITTENLNKDYQGVTFNNTTDLIAGIKYEPNDILFGNIRPYLKKVWLSDRRGCVNSDVLVFHINNENPKFINNLICSDSFLSHVMNGAKGTKMPRGDKNQILDFCTKLPSLAEQQKIADFLSNVDSIIIAETKILNTLQKKKKALMQKLFTRQLRFKSDDGTDFPAWEEKKLGEVCSYIGGGTPSKKVKEYWNGNINWASVKDITGKYLYETQDKISQLGADSSATNICEPDSLLLITRMSPGKTVITKCITAINQDLKIVKSDINVEFLHLLFQSIQTKIDEKTSGTTVKGISIEGLNQIDIRLPCKAEQQKITACLSSLDSLIQTQQKVVTTWQQRKKALLQQMFI